MSSNIKETAANALEAVIGEYVLNISKETLKLSLIRGKIKLDNVQLDGNAIGSLLFDSGNHNFAVLNCQARQMRCSINWTALEKEATKMEFRGVHLLVVPVTSSHSKESVVLRTKAKRSALARFEHKFFAGKIPGENDSVQESRRPNKEISDEGVCNKRNHSFVDRLKRKALANLEFSMKDVHIRFECPVYNG